MESRRVIRLIAALVCLSLCACGGRESTVEHPGDYLPDVQSPEPRLERVALTTEVDPITFAPMGEPSRSFSPDTPRIHLCFRVKNADPGSSLRVSWFREGDPEPLSSSRTSVAGDQWIAAEHAPDRAFRPGPHSVRVELEGEVLQEISFTISGRVAGVAAPLGAPRITRFRFVSRLDRRGRPRGRRVTDLVAGSKQIHCAFNIRVARGRVPVEVRWIRGDRTVTVTDLGPVEGRQTLTASLASEDEIPGGTYQVDVVAGDDVVHRAVFGVGVRAAAPAGPAAVERLALSTAIHARTRRPRGPTTTTLRGDEETIYLTLRYSGMSSGDSLEVHWFQEIHPEAPMVVSTFDVRESGRLAASFSPDSLLPPGDYRVDVLRAGGVIGTLSFAVEP